MGSGFTFDDIRSSAPRSIGASARIAKLTETIAALKAKRDLLAVTRSSKVAPLDHRLAVAQESLKKLMLGAGPRQK